MKKSASAIILFFFSVLEAKEQLKPSLEQATIPIHPVKETIYQTTYLAGNIEPLESADVRTGWDTLISSVKVRVGDAVKKDSVLASVDTKSVQYYMNYYLLFKQQAIDSDASNRKQFKFLQKRLTNLDNLVKRGTIAIKSVEEVEKQAIEFQKSFLANAQQIKNITSQIYNLKNQAAITQLRSPIDGVVSRLIVDSKQIQGPFTVDPGAIFATIQVPGSFKIRAFAYDFQMGNIKEGMPCSVSWGDFSEAIKCQISSVDKFVEKKSNDIDGKQPDSGGRFIVIATFKYSAHTIPFGCTAKVSIPSGQQELALTVPWNAVQVSIRGNFVNVMDHSNAPSERAVTLGKSFGSRVSIIKGIRENDIIISRLY